MPQKRHVDPRFIPVDLFADWYDLNDADQLTEGVYLFDPASEEYGIAGTVQAATVYITWYDEVRQHRHGEWRSIDAVLQAGYYYAEEE